jgi:hypothetical protein
MKRAGEGLLVRVVGAAWLATGCSASSGAVVSAVDGGGQDGTVGTDSGGKTDGAIGSDAQGDAGAATEGGPDAGVDADAGGALLPVCCAGDGGLAPPCGNVTALPRWTWDETYDGGSGTACATIGADAASAACIPCTLVPSPAPECAVSIPPWTLSYNPSGPEVTLTEVSCDGGWTLPCGDAGCGP